MSKFLKDYFSDLANLLDEKNQIANLNSLKNLILESNKNGGIIYIMGNGGSAALASHVTVDLSKNAQIKAVNFNEADLITCLANDYGYEFWMEKALAIYSSNENDLIILVSSSGNSQNVRNAASWSVKNNRNLVTFTGMSHSNPLKELNSNGLNFWVDSMAYNHIEMIHHIWLLAVTDSIIGKTIYAAS